MIKTLFFTLLFSIYGLTFSQNKFSNDLLLKVIYQHQYDVNTEALLPYLKHKESKYRMAAALAFASVQDTLAIEALFGCLDDEEMSVRNAAVYSLGQLRSHNVTIRMMSMYSDKKYKALQNEFLMAIGKSALASDTVFYGKIQMKLKDSAAMHAYTYSVYIGYRRKPLSEKMNKNIESIKEKNVSPMVDLMCHALLTRNKLSSEQIKNEIKDTSMRVSIHSMRRLFIMESNPYRINTFLDQTNQTESLLDSLAFDTSVAYVIRSYCLEVLIKRKAYTDTLNLKRLFESGNIAFVSMACEILRNDSNLIAERKYNEGYLKSIQKSLQMPKDFEAWNDLAKTIARINHTEFNYINWFNTGYKNPINWEYVKRIPSDQKLVIVTTKGAILMTCKVDAAPASVAHFLQLVDSGFYDGKYFHRMVPNFVVQGGCPRGDGWGGLDWVQRSEFSNNLRYQPGSIGLASSGKDSEGVQFFITHTYTPHLDGRYTIFAEVIEGMDVVNQLVVGDQILSIQKL